MNRRQLFGSLLGSAASLLGIGLISAAEETIIPGVTVQGNPSEWAGIDVHNAASLYAELKHPHGTPEFAESYKDGWNLLVRHIMKSKGV